MLKCIEGGEKPQVNKRQRIAQVILNVLIIAELCVSVVLAGREPELFTIIFFKYFFMMLIPTVILGIFALKLLRTREPQTGTAGHAAEREMPKATKTASRIRQRNPASAYAIPKILARGHGEFARMSQWKNVLLKGAALFLFITFVSLIDSCQSKFRTPLNVFHVLPGAAMEISGPLEKIVPIGELTYISTSDLIRLSISEVRTGIWFGGTMWIGRLTVSRDIMPGEYRLMVIPEGYRPEPEKPVPVMLVNVYQDHRSLRQSFKSFIRRVSGIPPWGFVAFCLPLAGLSLGAVFLISRKIEYLLAREGMAEVYRVRQGETRYEIAFGLGKRHGVAVDRRLALLDKRGQFVGTVVVQNVSETDSLAIADFKSEVMPGYIVSMSNNQSPK